MRTKLAPAPNYFAEKLAAPTGNAPQSAIQPENRPENRPKPVKYTYLKRRLNPEYDAGIRLVPDRRWTGGKGDSFEASLKTINSDRNLTLDEPQIVVKTRPKWHTDLMGWTCDTDTGEMFPAEIYTSDDFKVSNGKKIKALDAFCAKYQPLYQRKKVTLLFLTFTGANKARKWSEMVHLIKKRFLREGLNLRGFIWTAEISDRLHYHYHMCIAIDRVKWTKIPERVKFEGLWGQHTEIDFVKKNIRHYMAKYFAKCDARVLGSRSYGKSNKYL